MVVCWCLQVEWYIYYLIVFEVGVLVVMVDVIWFGVVFVFELDDDVLIYVFVIELYDMCCVSDVMFVCVQVCFGYEIVVNFVVLFGYYVFVVMMLNMFGMCVDG